jgi:hypothetical protein
MVKPNINSVEIHPQLSNNGHPVDDALVGAGSLWPSLTTNGKSVVNLAISEKPKKNSLTDVKYFYHT